MTYTIEFGNSQNFVELKWQGEVFIEELIQAFAEIVSDDRYIPGLGFLIDYRNATPMLMYKDMETLALFADKAPANYKSAAVMKDEIDVALAQIWQEYGRKLEKEDFSPFTNYQEAVDWLNKV